MKKLFVITLALGFILAISNLGWAQCATIKDGTITAKTGETLTTGYDEFGYNYQAHIFNGRYCDYDRMIGGSFCDVKLVMKWSDTWLSNKDCNGDDVLDRGYPCDPINASSSACEGAWLTNHQSGLVEMPNGKFKKWTYFVKIVMVPDDAYVENNYWYTVNGIEIGPVIWGAYAIIQQVSNDPFLGEHGILYKSPAGPGLGKY